MYWFTLYLDYWIPGLIVLIALVAILAYLTIKAHRNKVTTGAEGILGEKGVYQGNGQVLVHGELWHIKNADGFEVGDKVEIFKIDGLILEVRKM